MSQTTDTDQTITSTMLNIRSAYSSLTSAEKKIVDFIMTHTSDVIHYTVNELAEKCDSSLSSVVRACQKMGFKGFYDFKITLAQELVTSPMEVINEDIMESDNSILVYEKLCAELNNTLQYTKAVLMQEELDKAIDAILKANRIAVFGMGNSASVAADMAHKLMRIGFNISAYADSHMQCIAASYMQPGDVVIGISHSGSSKDIVDGMEVAKKSGATTVAITNYTKSPIIMAADIKLFTASDETKFRIEAQASRLAQLVIIDTIYTYISLKMSKAAVEKIHKVEKALQNKKY